MSAPAFKRQQGVVLISVLLIIALATIVASQMSNRIMGQLQRASNIEVNQQAYWYAMGAEAFAKRVIETVVDQDPDFINLSQIWAQGETTYPVDNGQIVGEISDLQACFNLNALRPLADDSDNNEKSVQRLGFERLLVNLAMEDVDQFTAEYMVDALIDWLDENSSIVSAGGAEDNDYAGREFPYLAANHYLADISELRVIEHFTMSAINQLKDYVCVLPNTNLHKLNVNTISEEHAVLLQSFLDISLEDAQEIISERGESGFEKIDDVLALQVLTNAKLTSQEKEQLTVDSDYFQLSSRASFNNSFFTLVSTLKVENNKRVDVIRRSVGKN
ncbi:type II secretion system minor pseudopilin GspK [Thalassotalea sp. LPB0316]|uniref:type II secretion system minor pseudopilin GspK n=1 Tax=Thalassotalea sp. LPB0316 TaxID=2769490 RepID=UPI00186863CB|nr:type II secretion system minor pseudopilin GspK [Thalassotalea sp. LPB0316]QOL26594.1 type II secretion system minor pseudopilin GspK [Thalassotalea sp. LPB0316]